MCLRVTKEREIIDIKYKKGFHAMCLLWRWEQPIFKEWRDHQPNENTMPPSNWQLSRKWRFNSYNCKELESTKKKKKKISFRRRLFTSTSRRKLNLMTWFQLCFSLSKESCHAVLDFWFIKLWVNKWVLFKPVSLW